jgi:hypothetical protein
MVGRSDNFEIRINYVRRLFQLSEQQWAKARKEMELAGYFQQVRLQVQGGKFAWDNIVFAESTKPSPQKPWGGQPPDGGPWDDPPRHGKAEDKPIGSSTKKSNTKKRLHQ